MNQHGLVTLTGKRRSTIIEEVNRNQIVRVADLSEHLGVSEVSIRRDLQYLEALGLLKRVHGGAVLPGNRAGEDAYPTRMSQQGEQKERIGRAAAEMIRKGERVIFDSGTTPLQAAMQLPDDLLAASGSLTVITAYLPVVRALGHRLGVNLILLGGIYLPEYEVVAGPQTIEQLKELHADKMFMGADGMTLSHGLTTANVLEAEVDRAMVKASTEVIVVSDSTKIGALGLASIMPVTQIHKLITDTQAPHEFVATLRDHGVEVILV